LSYQFLSDGFLVGNVLLSGQQLKLKTNNSKLITNP